jgi:hypothetical protein
MVRDTVDDALVTDVIAGGLLLPPADVFGFTTECCDVISGRRGGMISSTMTDEGALLSDLDVVKDSSTVDVYRVDVDTLEVVWAVSDVLVSLRKGKSRRGNVGNLSLVMCALESLASA